MSVQSPISVPDLGYFAFPLPSDPKSFVLPKAKPTPQPPHAESSKSATNSKPKTSSPGNEQDTAFLEEQTARLQLEADEIRKGEEDWVRAGGVLRDARGRRDRARTEALRAEIRLREREQMLAERWARYEGSWRSVYGSSSELGFGDMPWPVEIEAPTLDDLKVDRIQEFFLEGLAIRGSTVQRKDRIRASLLRWHPDKLGTVLARVREEDADEVQHGINMVVMSLKKLMN